MASGLKKAFCFVIFFLLMLIPASVGAQENAASIEKPAGFWDISSWVSFTEMGLGMILGTVGVLSIFGFIIAVILFLTAGDSEDRLHTSSSFFVSSLVGLVISIAGLYLFYYLQRILVI